MSLLIVTGMSGSGKTKAIQALEDIGYFCVDNLPPQLIEKFAELSERSELALNHLALVVDVRGGRLFRDFHSIWRSLKSERNDLRLLFLDAEDETLLRRYKEERRRRHPLAAQFGGNLSRAIQEERRLLEELKQEADFILDSSQTRSAQLIRRIQEMFSPDFSKNMLIRIMSFGYKNGLPKEADLVFDLRCLPNPFYQDRLREKTGLEKEVQEYVMNSEHSLLFYEKIRSLLDFSLPLYRAEGKAQFVIAFGCTGGRHRSVSFAEKLAQDFRELGNPCSLEHREIEKSERS